MLLGLVSCLGHFKDVVHKNDKFSVSDIQKIYQELESYEPQEEMTPGDKTKKENTDKWDEEMEDYHLGMSHYHGKRGYTILLADWL